MGTLHLQRAGYWLFVLGMLVMAPLSAWAQTSVLATMTGVITDSSGAVIADAAITAVNTGTQQTAKASTNPSGNYVLPNLPPATMTFGPRNRASKRAKIRGYTLTRPPPCKSIARCK